MSEQDLQQRYRRAVMGTYAPQPRALTRGDGVYVWDESGARYLDLLAGIAVNALGHAHPAVIRALEDQARTLGHISNLFISEPQVRLAEKLLDLAQAPEGSGIYFANSGAEANEAAFKLARRTGRPRLLALEGAFHGRTMGALAMTHKSEYREPFSPLPGGVTFVPANDSAALERELSRGDVAAVIAEPIQGEAGVHPLAQEYLLATRHLTRKYGSLLILDEVQTGIGRTGRWFAHPWIQDFHPDVITVAKGLGGGFPIGALIALGEHPRSLLGLGQHGTTFGGNPLGCACALAVLAAIEDDGLLDSACAAGDHCVDAVLNLGDPRVTEVRGRGLLRGIALRDPVARELCARAFEAGFIVNAPNPRTIRIAPPLIITDEQLDTFVQALPVLLDRAQDDAAQKEN